MDFGASLMVLLPLLQAVSGRPLATTVLVVAAIVAVVVVEGLVNRNDGDVVKADASTPFRPARCNER